MCKLDNVNEGNPGDTLRRLHTGRESGTVDNDSEREEHNTA
ncbi:hypothetical protein D854_gp57 [Streptomyces phage R4]|uniref:Uncharacterized protein n=1 Tax=Streptomyces phage R4 TaxID=10732 RepID=K4I2N4_9CAUD|nr:hypothetical protein D854_gp57 [Streptomyces phage R4]AFU62085.1 hypothetical protein R4_32 [Streptomyces phage R4]